MTHYYHIKSRYINSQETFVYAIIGCIYTEIWESDRDLDEPADAIASFTRCFKDILTAYRDPNNGFLDCFDVIESCYRATAYHKLQKLTDELMGFLDSPVVVHFDSESVKPYLDFLPDFHGKIEIYTC